MREKAEAKKKALAEGGADASTKAMPPKELSFVE